MLRNLAPLVLLACCGCASFHGRELPKLDRNELASQPRLPAISYECRVGPNPSSPPGGGWPSAAAEVLFCSAFAEARRGPAANDLHIDLAHLNVIRQPIFSITLGFFTLASLGILPTYIEEDVTLSVRVEYQGKLAREYIYRDHINTWIELFLLPWAFSHDPIEIERATDENLLLHFLRDLRKDLPLIVPAGEP